MRERLRCILKYGGVTELRATIENFQRFPHLFWVVQEHNQSVWVFNQNSSEGNVESRVKLGWVLSTNVESVPLVARLVVVIVESLRSRSSKKSRLRGKEGSPCCSYKKCTASRRFSTRLVWRACCCSAVEKGECRFFKPSVDPIKKNHLHTEKKTTVWSVIL